MASISATSPEVPTPSDGVMDKGLKKNAIGYLSNIVIGVASTAPAYSLAATLGFIVAVKGVGVHAPAVMLVAFIPMLLVAAAYKYFNRADPDAGTSFAWTTRTFGPMTRWMNGWAIFLSDVIVMASLAAIAAIYTFKLFGFTELGESKAAIIIAAVLWIALMTWICYRGIELSARIQQFLLSAEVFILGVFCGRRIRQGLRQPPPCRLDQALALLDQSVCDELLRPRRRAAARGLHLLGLGFRGGGQRGVRGPRRGPGQGRGLSTILLVLIYVVVTAAAQSFHGVGFLTNEANQEDVLNALGSGVLGSTLNKLLIIAVLTSASASTQTTILPTARTTLSMAHWKAVTSLLSRVHKRYLTPTVSTLGFGLLSIIITVVLLLLSNSVLEDSLTAIGFPICFYYGFTGVACGFYYRRDLMESARNFLLLGLGPMIGGLMLFGVGLKAAFFYGHAENVSSKPILGITLPLWMGIGGMVLGGVIMIVSRPFFKEFFSRKTETAPPGLLNQPPPTGPVPGRVEF